MTNEQILALTIKANTLLLDLAKLPVSKDGEVSQETDLVISKLLPVYYELGKQLHHQWFERIVHLSDPKSLKTPDTVTIQLRSFVTDIENVLMSYPRIGPASRVVAKEIVIKGKL